MLGSNGVIPFPDGHFDTVTSFMVMEHVVDPVTFLLQIQRVLRPGGYYIGQSIHSRHYVTWIRRAFGLLPHRISQKLVKGFYQRDEDDTFPAYYRMNSERALARTTSAAGLNLVALPMYVDQGYSRFLGLAYRSAVITDWLMTRRGSNLGRLYFTVVLQKPPIALAPRLQAA